MDCTICMSEINENDSDTYCALVPCGHKFHPICIHRWINSSPNCPVCRTETSTCSHGDLWSHRQPIVREIVETILSSHQKQLQEKDVQIQILQDRLLCIQQQQINREHAVTNSDLFQLPMGIVQLLAHHAPIIELQDDNDAISLFGMFE
jgi:hypothetical protein